MSRQPLLNCTAAAVKLSKDWRLSSRTAALRAVAQAANCKEWTNADLAEQLDFVIMTVSWRPQARNRSVHHSS